LRREKLRSRERAKGKAELRIAEVRADDRADDD